jgi:ADP-heptose:LPS heptosyltransferase
MLNTTQEFTHIYSRGLWNVLTRTESIQNSKFLIIQLGTLRELCNLIPVCFSLFEEGYEVEVVCRPEFTAVWNEFLPEVVVHPTEIEKWRKVKNSQIAQTIYQREYEAVFVADIAPFSAFLSTFADAFYRYGIIEDRNYYVGSRMIFRHVHRAPDDEHLFNRFEKLFGLHILEFAATYKTFVGEIGDYIALYPGNDWLPGRWDKAKFLELAELIAKAGNSVEFIIRHSEKDLLKYFTTQIKSERISICKTENMNDLITAIKNCKLFIGNDVGASHVANLYAKPTIVLWNGGDYAVTRPLGENNTILKTDIDCRPCHRDTNAEQCEKGENLCLQQISVVDVFEAFEEKIKRIR